MLRECIDHKAYNFLHNLNYIKSMTPECEKKGGMNKQFLLQFDANEKIIVNKNVTTKANHGNFCDTKQFLKDHGGLWAHYRNFHGFITLCIGQFCLQPFPICRMWQSQTQDFSQNLMCPLILDKIFKNMGFIDCVQTC